MSCSLPFPEQPVRHGEDWWPWETGGPQPAEGSRGQPAPSLPLLWVLWHTFPPKFYFLPLPFPVQHQAGSVCSGGCRIKPRRSSRRVCFPASLCSAEFPRFTLGLSCRTSLRLHPLLQLPWLCRGFAGISIPVPGPAGLWVHSGACQHRDSALGNNPPGREDAIPDPALVTTAFILPTDTELNLFSATQIFDRGHTQLCVFRETSLFFLPITTSGHDAFSQTELHLPGRKRGLVLTSLQGIFTLAASDLRGQLLYLDL